MKKSLLALTGAVAALSFAACNGGGGGSNGSFLLAIGNSNLVSDATGTATTTLLVARQEYDGPITVTLGPDAPAGLTMDPLVIAEGATSGTIVLRRGTAPLGGPFDFSLIGTGTGDAVDDVRLNLLIADASGLLDVTFSGDGMATVEFSQGASEAHALIEMPDDSFVLAGEANGDFALARVNDVGDPVATFGSNGRVVTDFGGMNDVAWGVVRQFDGKIVAGGSATTNGDFSFALARYNATTGALDPTFGGDGKVTTHPGFEGGAWTLLLQPDGKILAGGTATVGVGSNFAMTLIRYDSTDGSLDTSFGGDGIVQHLMGPTHAETFALDIVTTQDGYLIVAGGYSFVGTERRWSAIFLDDAGDVLAETIGVGDGGEVRAVRIRENDFVVAGKIGTASPQGFIAGLRGTDGEVSNAFGPDGDGLYRTASGANGRALVIQNSGNLVLVGDLVGGDWTAWRTTDAGLSEATWNAPAIDFGGNDRAFAAFISRDTRVVVVGRGNGHMGIARLWP